MRNSKPRFPACTATMIKALGPIFAVACLLVIYKPSAHAVPSYSRQTGLPCATCHFTPPELTPFGRKFKLDGYVFTAKPEVTDNKKDHNAALRLLEVFPLSVVFDTSFTNLKTPEAGTQNGNFQFPGRFAIPCWCMGESRGQLTYTGQGNHFSWDNTDVRYANNRESFFGKPLVLWSNVQ